MGNRCPHKLIILQLPKKFPAFHKTRNFITTVIRAHNWIISPGSLIYPNTKKGINVA